jgi:6-phosphogluconolactonase (cycloisomerase 2 family)
VERCLQRHKVQNRPELPQTRQDLILQPEHTVTADGRRFVLIDNRMADRIMVFSTERNLNRLTLSTVVHV